MATVPTELWTSALPRLLAVAYGLAMTAALIIRALWRRHHSHLWYRSARRHARPPLKSSTGPDGGWSDYR